MSFLNRRITVAGMTLPLMQFIIRPRIKGEFTMAVSLRLNGESVSVESSEDTPLLYVLIDELGLKGPRFGCGLAQCGSCSVLVDGVEIRSCVTPLSAIGDQELTTLEGLPLWYAAERGQNKAPDMTPIQEAFVDEQAIQCGYCYNGMIIKASELLSDNADPDEATIRNHMNGHLCRCGTYPKIISAIQKAAKMMKEQQA